MIGHHERMFVLRRTFSFSSLVAVIGVIVAVFAASTAAAEADRLALVIGISSYENVAPLANPIADAQDVASVFQEIGFDVTLALDLTQQEMREALQQFGRSAAGAEMAVIYFAGHGMEIDRINYLVPVDAEFTSLFDVEFDSIPLDLLQRAVSGAGTFSLIILDACRDNPFERAVASNASRSLGRGLAAVEPAANTLLAYAARAGTIAYDGAGRNSPYAEALIETLPTPGLEVALLFRRVRDRVLQATDHRQEPFTYGSLGAEPIYLVPPQEPPVAAVRAVAPDSTAWLRLGETIGSGVPDEAKCEAIAKFIADHPDSPFTTAANVNWQLLGCVAPGENLGAGSTVADPPGGSGLGSSETASRVGPSGLGEPTGASGLGPSPDLGSAEAIGPSNGEIEALSGSAPQSEADPFAALREGEEQIGLTRDRRRRVQLGLQLLGFDPRGIDGLFGPNTRSAISGWQQARGLSPTGFLTQGDYQALMAEARAPMEVWESRSPASADASPSDRIAVGPNDVVRILPSNVGLRLDRAAEAAIAAAIAEFLEGASTAPWNSGESGWFGIVAGNAYRLEEFAEQGATCRRLSISIRRDRSRSVHTATACR